MAKDAATTCLLLEDDFVLRSLVELQLRDMGVAHVAAFATADEALGYLAGETPGFGIVDYRLERLQTGADVARELVRLGVPTVIATGLGEVPDTPKGLENVPLLEKPVSPETFRTHLQKAGLIAP